MRFIITLLLIINFLSAGDKIALLIGNNDYSFQPLANPLNDVDGIYKTLRAIGFEKSDIKVLKNASKTKMETALANFSQRASSAEIALVYFSGHGMQVNNTNYMFPAKANPTKPVDLFGLVDLNYFIQSASSAKYGIILVDACRTNPLVKYFQNGKHKGSTAKKGLGQVTPKTGQVVISFATSAGDTADDGNGNMSPYARALSERLKEPNKDITKVLGLVALDVSAKYEQKPVYKGNLAYNVCLNGRCTNNIDMGLALCYFAKNGDIDAIRKYLDNGVDINSKNVHGETALMYASDTNQNIVKRLIEEGSNVNIENNRGATALMWASEGGHFNIVKMLIESGANINLIAKGDNMATALALASYNGHTDIVKMLIKAGADVNLGSSSLVSATINNHNKIINILIEEGADINGVDTHGTTPLIAAAENGNLALVKLFVKLGANIDTRTKIHNASALMYASQTDEYLDVVEYLILKGANTNYKWSNNGRKETSLERAKMSLKENPNSKYDILVKLLSKK